MKVKSESEVAQSCTTLHDPMDCSLPGSFFHGISQARVLEWVAIAFSDLRSYELGILSLAAQSNPNRYKLGFLSLCALLFSMSVISFVAAKSLQFCICGSRGPEVTESSQ